MSKALRLIRFSLVLLTLPQLVCGEPSTHLILGTLPDVERLALAQHPTVRLAQEEADVLAAKRKEAYRAIWPNVLIKGEQTEGEAVRDLGTPDFTEKSYGVQVTQPLFQGGRLYRIYRQTEAQWESAQAKYAKARQEVLFSAREATWNLAKARRAQELYENAYSELAKEMKSADNLYAQDAITRQAYLTISAQYQQAGLTLEGAKAETEARLWQWTAALGLETPPEFKPEFSLAVSTATAISLEECLRLARANHPELVVQRKSADAARQGDLAGKSYVWPKISVNGFYGRSGGAFRGETLHLGEDWQAGVQLSQYFGLNTLNVSGLQQETSPKIGQSTRTASKTAAGSVSFLDGFKQKSEAKDAHFLYDQARVQEERTQMEIANSVREAYANMKKATAQLKIAENGVPLAKTDFGVAKIKSAHRETPFSERSVTRNRLAQAEAALIEARAAYHIARAALNRAVGAPDMF